MIAFVLRRLIQAVIVMVAVAFIAFLLFQYVGDPVVFLLGQDAKPEQIAQLRRDLGLDQPFYVQFWHFLVNAAQGEFGLSLRQGAKVSRLLGERFPATLELAIVAAIMAVAVGIPMGVYAALRRGSFMSQVFMTVSLLGVSLPTFLIGILLILVFSVQFQSWGLPWLPSGGMFTIATAGALDDRLVHLILPTAALAIPGMAGLIRYTRSAMLEQLGQDYVRTARAKGLRRPAVTLHAFRNSLLPIVTLLGLNLPLLFSGALVVEVIFQWPGMGQLAYTAAMQRDYTVLMALVVVSSVLVVVGNLLADVVYGLLDPRVGYS
jgi:peptide/nickel transport system permease protein